MLRSRNAMRRRWRQIANSGSIQDFEVEDSLIEIPRAQLPLPYTSHLDNLSFLHTSNPLPSLPSVELPCSSMVDTVGLPSVSQASDYMSLKIAADLIPRFDGTSCSLTEFIRQCRDVDSKVKPTDRLNLLAIAVFSLVHNNFRDGAADFLIDTGSQLNRYRLRKYSHKRRNFYTNPRC